MQQLYGNWSVVTGSKAALSDVQTLLDQPLLELVNQPEPNPHTLKQSIRFDNVSFQYNNIGPWVLEGIDLTIFKGARIGLLAAPGVVKAPY